jgi:hypothetical protein
MVKSRNGRIDQGIELFRDFRGEDPRYIKTVRMVVPDVAVLIGTCDGVLYTTQRNGRIEEYIHKFEKKARPLLASSFDGRGLFLIGGSYNFTDRGIVDKT